MFHKAVQFADMDMKGVPEWGFVKYLTKIGIHINKEYAFHNTNLSERK